MVASRSRRRNIRSYTMILALLVIWLVMFILTKGTFVTPRNLSNLFVQMSIVGVLATGMVLIIISGNIDLSVGSLLGMLGGFAAILQVAYHLDTVTTLLLTLLLGVIVGVIQGSVISYLRVPAFIVTLGGLLAFRGILLAVTNGRTISPVNETFRVIGQEYLPKLPGLILACAIGALLLMLELIRLRKNHQADESGNSRSILPFVKALWFPAVVIAFTLVMNDYKGVPIPVIIMLGTIAVFSFIANRSVFGRSIYAIGGNKDAAVYSGIRVNPIIFGIFILQGALCAVGGAILTARLNAGTVSAGQNLELDVIAAAVIGGASLAGGVGTVPGAMLGALVMASLNNGLSILNVESFWQYILKGIILVAAVYIDVINSDKK
jgi:D-xylose transport system permease protein